MTDYTITDYTITDYITAASPAHTPGAHTMTEQRDTWTPQYSQWRHGGWYVHNIRYPSGAIGCVSRNYPDNKWRIACDPRRLAHLVHTYPTRDAAARAELRLIEDIASGWLCTYCGEYFEPESSYCGLCGHDLAEQKGRRP